MICQSASTRIGVTRASFSRRTVPSVRRPSRPVRQRVHAQSNPLEGFINSLTIAVKNSPFNEGKKQLAILQAGSYDEAAVKAKLDAYIKENPVVVFSWTTCPFCIKAKGLLTDLGVKFTAVELNTMEDGNAIRAELAKMTDRTSMPNIFIAGKGVGGCNDGPGVITLNNEGKLVDLLKAAGAL